MEQLFLGVFLLVAGVLLIALGRNNSRSIKARDITNSTIIQGDVNINAAPAEQKPARGWVEWLGFAFGAVGFADIALKLIRGG
jgi:hypothetical protein